MSEEILDKQFRSDLKPALLIVWKIVSIVCIVITGLAFLDPDILLKLSPACLSIQLYGTECFMCGMTRAFIEIGKLNLSEALQLNSFSIALFSCFVINSITSIIYHIYRINFGSSFRNILKSNIN